jgi:hypothetical protein
MFRRWRRPVLIGVVLSALVLTTASSCEKGSVIEVTWHQDSLGNDQCDITVRPDDMDSAPFKLKNQHKNRCNRCPVGARWPACNKDE